MKVITKKLKEEIFVWDPNAFGGKGYWFVLGTKGGYGKAASKKEADKLGKPDLPKETAKQETASVSPVDKGIKAVPQLETPPEQAPVTKVIKEVTNNTQTIIKEIPSGNVDETEEKVSPYEKAERIRKTSLSDLITKKIIEGGGVRSSIKASLKEKTKARVMGIKQAFDPLNIANKLTGNLGAAILGRKTGRSEADMRFFTGLKANKATASRVESRDNNTSAKINVGDVNAAMHTKVAEGQKKRVLKGDSASDVLAKLYNLIKQYHDEDMKRLEIQRDLKKEKDAQENRWHEELIQAITGRKKGKNKNNKTGGGDGFNIWDYLKTALKTALEFLVKTIRNIFKGIMSGMKNIIKATVGVFKKFIEGPIKALKSLIVDAFKKMKDFVAPIIKATREALEFIGKNFASLARKVGLTSLAENIEKAVTKTEEKAVEKIGAETAEKTLAESTEKAGGKAIEKVAVEETEKIAEKTAGKSLLKKIPGLAAIAGLAFGAQRAIGGDLTGAALEVASGFAGAVPVVGTATSIGIDSYLAARDFGLVGSENKAEPTATPTTEPAPTTASTPTATPTPIASNQTAATQTRTGVDLSNKGQRPTMVNDPRLSMAAPTPPQANPLTERVQNVINKNNDMKLEQNVAPKTTVIDNSKKITAGGGSSTEDVTVNAVPVRNDEDTWLKLQRTNFRPV